MEHSNSDSLELIAKITKISNEIVQNPNNFSRVKELQSVINEASPMIVQAKQSTIFAAFFYKLKLISENLNSYTVKDKHVIIDTFTDIFKKVKVDKMPLFFNIFTFILSEIYDPRDHRVLDLSEEYKLSIVQCMISLSKAATSSLISELYTKKNVDKLSCMLFVLLKLTKTEQYKTLRISATNCIMSIARILEDDDFSDIVTRDQVADVFLFFLPGLLSQLKDNALVDEKYGHKIPAVTLKAWGRLCVLMMQNYQKIDLKKSNKIPAEDNNVPKFEDDESFKKYIDNTKRCPAWYHNCDKKIQQLVTSFSKLTLHSHSAVQLELLSMCSLIIENCISTMPLTISSLIPIVIILTQDSQKEISSGARQILEDLARKLDDDDFKVLLESLEEGFYNSIKSLPRKFNAVDEKEQIAAIQLLIGYISLFGKHNLNQVLHSVQHLNKLISTLLHVSEFDKSQISVMQEYITGLSSDYEDPLLPQKWKQFRHFKDDQVWKKIEGVCHVLAEFGAGEISSNFLLDSMSVDHRKECIFLLNALVVKANTRSISENILNSYLDDAIWFVPLSVSIDDLGHEHTLGDVKNNIIQVCLLCEGLGQMALSLGQNQFKFYLIRVMYRLLERAGSGHPLIRTSALLALQNISKSCSYDSITDLITENMDYITFNIERKLKRRDDSAVSVFGAVIKHGSKTCIESTSYIIGELLEHIGEHYNDDQDNLNSYLFIFKVFISHLYEWSGCEKLISDSLKTKKEKEMEFEQFRVSNVETINDFSDDIMEGKSADDLYKEDMERKQQGLDSDDEDYDEPEVQKKAELPLHVGIAKDVLATCLHFLPSKNRDRKLLVLGILTNGLPILKDFEDDLLPLVHQIWSPLVDRFKEIDDPLIINYSYNLLFVLGRLSKDFIRMRTSKEVLPHVLTTLDKLAKESYLRDQGSAYRYSQAYKLQCSILDSFGRLLIDLDVSKENLHKSIEVLFKYVSDKQPLDFQSRARKSLALLKYYDPDCCNDKVSSEVRKYSEHPDYSKVNILQVLEDEVVSVFKK